MITGNQAPKFAKTGGGVLLLDFFKNLKDEPIFDNLIHKSVINGSQNIVIKGYHWGFEGNVNLWKYANPAAKYNELYSYLYAVGQLYRHRDFNPIKDDSGTAVNFILNEIVPYYIPTDGIPNVNYDAAIVRFISTKYVDMSQDVTSIAIQPNEILISGVQI